MTSGAGRPDYLLPVAVEQRGWTSFVMLWIKLSTFMPAIYVFYH